MATNTNRLLLSRILLVISAVVLVVIYYLPVWWVSLTAPNYPEEAFPDGVRINFHMNGVFNGCQKINKDEIAEDEALDCVHEMDTINHYVGMYPIAAGGVVERAFSPFLVALLVVMLLSFVFISTRNRLLVLAVGFSAITVWMSMTWYGQNGLNYHNKGYVYALVSSMDQDSDRDKQVVIQDSSGTLALLKNSLALAKGESVPVQEVVKVEKKVAKELSAKGQDIAHLKSIFDADQAKKPKAERLIWDGSASQMMSWHYAKNLGRYFNNPEEIIPMVKVMGMAAEVVFFGIIGAMLLLMFGVWRKITLLNALLILVPMALPLFFMIEYSAWLYWYGHTMNSMGAFTVKPFMPTVFGQGKVAQFTTHSYPAFGFFVMLAMAVMLALSALMRKKHIDAEKSK